MSNLKLECGIFRDFGQDLLVKELKLFKKTLNDVGITFFLTCGTCLGFVREGQFLEHDKDIDIGIFEDVDLEKLKKVLEAVYINVSIYGEDNGKIVWANREINGALLVFEIQVHYRKDGKIFMNRDLEEDAPQRYIEGRLEWSAKFFDNMKIIKHRGEEYLIPTFVEEYLYTAYGNWKIKEEWKDWRYNMRNIHEGWL